MTLGGWLVTLLIVVPLVTVLVWALVRASIVRVPMGSLGILVVNGKSTNRSFVPGIHWVAAFRKRQCVSYPAVELSYRATADPVAAGAVEAAGPPLRVILGDRAEAVVSYTVRFRLVPEDLLTVHDRFGPGGYWSAVRDDSGAAVAAVLAEPDVTIDSLFPGERSALESRLKDGVAAALGGDGMRLTGFSLGAVDLGRTGETIQATVRTRLELAREEAGAAIQELRVRQDAELAKYLTDVGDTALRYRQTEVWRDLAYRPDPLRFSFPVSGPLGGESLPVAPTDQAVTVAPETNP